MINFNVMFNIKSKKLKDYNLVFEHFNQYKNN